MTDARSLPANGKCHDCGKPVSGERKLCGLCAARRNDESTRQSNKRSQEAARRVSQAQRDVGIRRARRTNSG